MSKVLVSQEFFDWAMEKLEDKVRGKKNPGYTYQRDVEGKLVRLYDEGIDIRRKALAEKTRFYAEVKNG